MYGLRLWYNAVGKLGIGRESLVFEVSEVAASMAHEMP